MTKSYRRRRLVVATALGAVLMAAGCTSAVDQADQAKANASAKEGGTLTVAQANDAQPESFLSPALGNITAQYAVFETLTQIDTKTGEPKGVLAKSWTMAPDYKSMDLELRDDVTFHSGRKMTSADVIYTIQQVQNPANTVGTRFIAEQIASATADGDHGVKLTFKRALPNVFDLFEIMPIVDQETFANYKDGKQVVGTGRFTWQSWTPGGKLELAKYPGYRDAKNTHLDKIEIQVITDPTAELAAVRSGRVQYAMSLSTLDTRTLSGEPGYALVKSGGAAQELGFDVTQAPFDNELVRQAVHYAIDRDRIVDQVEGGQAEATALPWKTSTPGYDAKQGERYTYQPEKAKQLLAQAGVNGASFSVVVPDIPESVAIFEIVQNNLKEVGLNATAQVVSTTDYDQRIAQRNLGAPAFLMRCSNALSPASAVVSRPELVADKNNSHFTSPEYTKVVDALTGALTDDAQKQALANYNDYFLDQAFALPVLTRSTLSVRSAKVDGITSTIQGFINLDTAYLTD
ncbi:ABC transporter substrate-binding protein [Actinophytocola sp.]|uniref:ABC transporter substrate-binding protein n=1 Tax=Actinophytocola sp. TaxID=1872138 RepID=UPI002ED6BDDB